MLGQYTILIDATYEASGLSDSVLCTKYLCSRNWDAIEGNAGMHPGTVPFEALWGLRGLLTEVQGPEVRGSPCTWSGGSSWRAGLAPRLSRGFWVIIRFSFSLTQSNWATLTVGWKWVEMGARETYVRWSLDLCIGRGKPGRKMSKGKT